MHLIVEQCVAQVREAAGLASVDDAVSLPRTPALPKQPPPLPKRQPPPLPKEIESSNALLGLAPTMSWDDLAAQLPAPTTLVVAPRMALAPPLRWPLFLCAFIAGVSAGAALIASPAGQRPAVRHVVVAARAQASHVVASLRSIR